MKHLFVFVPALLLFAACSDDEPLGSGPPSGTPDSGMVVGGGPDSGAGLNDSGMGLNDSGTGPDTGTDAGVGIDAGMADGGTVTPDGGTTRSSTSTLGIVSGGGTRVTDSYTLHLTIGAVATSTRLQSANYSLTLEGPTQ